MTFFEHMYGVSQSTNVSKDIGFYLDQLFSPRLGYQVLARIVKNRKKMSIF
jgi:hypothetical protein